MEHQVLARKWRPRDFKQMVGQEHVLQALVNALEQNRLHHAYLFTGTRGVGKTTIARILAKCLNCEQGVGPVPCDSCSACIEVNEGRCVDLIEVDAASRTKVDDTRELLENVQYAPTRNRFKVYLIDEVHMLSSHSFNALLKTLEEPPPHVKFLLATTDPQKLPVTVLSRCLQFNLKNMPPEQIVRHLKYVLTEEQIQCDESALWQISRAAKGSMRDALSLTDQAIGYGQGTVGDADVSAMLGSIDQQYLFRILDALCNEDAKALLQQVADLSQYAPDYEQVLEELIGLLHRIAVKQAVPSMISSDAPAAERVQEYAQQLGPEDLQLYYQIALIGRRDLPLNPDPRAGLEMVLLRMLAFRPQQPQDKKKRINSGLAQATAQQSRAGADKPGVQQTQQPIETASGTLPQSAAAGKVAVSADSGDIGDSTDSVDNRDAAQSLGGTPVAAMPVQPESPGPAMRALLAAEQRSGTQTQQEGPRLVVNNKTNREASLASDQGEVRRTASETQDDRTADENFSPEPVAREQVDRGNIGKQSIEQVRDDTSWAKLVLDVAELKGMSKNILMQSLYRSQDRLSHDSLRIDLGIDSQYVDLANASHQERINQALSQYSGLQVEIKISAAEGGETPAAFAQRMQQQAWQAAKQALEQDPQVQALVESFGAVLEEDSISPKKH